MIRANNSRANITKNFFSALVGLLIYGFGTYLTIQANLGVGPWDVLNLGISKTIHITYGIASISISAVMIIAILLLGESIGLGMIAASFTAGLSVDFLNYLDLIQPMNNMIAGIGLMMAGITIRGFSQYIYMKSALGCGPRDAFMVGLGKKVKRISIGIVATIINVSVTLIGWILGGKVGIGTIIFAATAGPIMEFEFNLMHFDAKAVKHQDIRDTFKVLIGKKISL